MQTEVSKGQGLLLSCVAGAVDGIGWVLLHVFTAHITGDTVHLGTGLGRIDLGSAWRPAFAIGAFVGGVAAGAWVRDACARDGLPARAIVMGLSGVLLAAFLALGLGRSGAVSTAGWFAALTAPAALAMGCQNAVTPRIAGRRVRTYITGTMTELAEALVAAAAGAAGERAGALARAAELFAVWLAYLVGAVVSGAAGTRWGFGAALLPIAGILAAIVVDLRSVWYTGARAAP